MNRIGWIIFVLAVALQLLPTRATATDNTEVKENDPWENLQKIFTQAEADKSDAAKHPQSFQKILQEIESTSAHVDVNTIPPKLMQTFLDWTTRNDIDATSTISDDKHAIIDDLNYKFVIKLDTEFSDSDLQKFYDTQMKLLMTGLFKTLEPNKEVPMTQAAINVVDRILTRIYQYVSAGYDLTLEVRKLAAQISLRSDQSHVPDSVYQLIDNSWPFTGSMKHIRDNPQVMGARQHINELAQTLLANKKDPDLVLSAAKRLTDRLKQFHIEASAEKACKAWLPWKGLSMRTLIDMSHQLKAGRLGEKECPPEKSDVCEAAARVIRDLIIHTTEKTNKNYPMELDKYVPQLQRVISGAKSYRTDSNTKKAIEEWKKFAYLNDFLIGRLHLFGFDSRGAVEINSTVQDTILDIDSDVELIKMEPEQMLQIRNATGDKFLSVYYDMARKNVTKNKSIRTTEAQGFIERFDSVCDSICVFSALRRYQFVKPFALTDELYMVERNQLVQFIVRAPSVPTNISNDFASQEFEKLLVSFANDIADHATHLTEDKEMNKLIDETKGHLAKFLKTANEDRCGCDCIYENWKETKWPYRLAAASIEEAWYTEELQIAIVRLDFKLDECDRVWTYALHNSAFGTRSSAFFLYNMAHSGSSHSNKFIGDVVRNYRIPKNIMALAKPDFLLAINYRSSVFNNMDYFHFDDLEEIFKRCVENTWLPDNEAGLHTGPDTVNDLDFFKTLLLIMQRTNEHKTHKVVSEFVSHSEASNALKSIADSLDKTNDHDLLKAIYRWVRHVSQLISVVEATKVPYNSALLQNSVQKLKCIIDKKNYSSKSMVQVGELWFRLDVLGINLDNLAECPKDSEKKPFQLAY